MAHGEFCWNELMTGDVAKAKAFYAKTIGWTDRKSTRLNSSH